MNKISKYQNIIISYLNSYLAETGGENNEVQRKLLIDKENNSFQLLSLGWRGNHYLFGPIFHFDILNGKIWMQCNNTEREVIDELIAAGVEKTDIVLGFVPKNARHFLGLGVE